MNTFELGRRIATERKRLSITQKALAEKLHVSPSEISNYERGERLPSLEALIIMCQLFHVSSDYLLDLNHDNVLDVTELSDDELSFIKTAIRMIHK